MAYARQTQDALDRLDQSLARLRTIIKNGQIEEAIQYMEQGELRERFEELQNMINISQTGNLGAMGTAQTGTL